MSGRCVFATAIGLFAAATGLSLGAAGAQEAPRDLAHAPSLSSSIGIASYYGRELDGRRTADGEIFDMHALSAAHKTLPLPCYARVTNLRNGRSIVVRVNDRGPYTRGRLVDLSARAASMLQFGAFGVAKVRLDYLGKARPAGAADKAMLVSLRSDDGSEIPLPKAGPHPTPDGVTVAARTVATPALAYASASSRPAAEVALEHAVLTPSAESPREPLSLASELDSSLRRLETTIAAGATKAVAVAKSPYGELVTTPFASATATP